MKNYLKESEIIDFSHSLIKEKAAGLAAGKRSEREIAEAMFLFVRDEIRHSGDHKEDIVTLKASDVLIHQTGWCYAKSHLLCALLRAVDIPCGLCYQRLSFLGEGAPYSLHGLNAVYLKKKGWYRIDARGNKEGVNASFSPPVERLAFPVIDENEADFLEIWADPIKVVIDALQTHKTYEEIYYHLPDVEVIKGK